MSEPEKFGRPLRKSLKGYWKLLVGDYRIMYKILDNKVIMLGIVHRKNVYKEIISRT